MSKFNATATQNIPANRLTSLTGVDGQDGIFIRLALSEEKADFVTKRDIEEGEEVLVTISDNPVWEVEASTDIPAGVSITVADGGTVAYDNEAIMRIGYSINSANAGDTVKFVRKYTIRRAWIREVDESLSEE